MRSRLLVYSILALAALCVLAVLIYNLPPVHERLAWRVANLRSQIYYALNPPQEVVFLPSEQSLLDEQALIESIVQATLDALPTVQAATPSPLPPTHAPVSTASGPPATSSPTMPPTAAPTAQPEQVTLNGLVHDYQRMNNCGPATLATLLSYWGWQGDQYITREYLRPNHARVDDKNVMPAEMVDFIESQTNLKALVRVGGDLDTVRRLLAAGFPVMIEKGFQPPHEDWMGHYEVINGYDDTSQRFITQDSYLMPDFPVPYPDLRGRWWRDFNYVYLVAYPPEREAELLDLLGPNADPTYNYQSAARMAEEETAILGGRDLFFAWFNLGSSRVGLGDYPGAAQAYDQAFAVYADLPQEERPWRVLWYQTGPYAAYYHTGRYQDVISLANTTLSFLSDPILEETLYWRGMAKEASGDMNGAVSDYTKAVRINSISTDASAGLQRLGFAP
jgi:hypothetical protein